MNISGPMFEAASVVLAELFEPGATDGVARSVVGQTRGFEVADDLLFLMASTAAAVVIGA